MERIMEWSLALLAFKAICTNVANICANIGPIANITSNVIISAKIDQNSHFCLCLMGWGRYLGTYLYRHQHQNYHTGFSMLNAGHVGFSGFVMFARVTTNSMARRFLFETHKRCWAPQSV